MNKPLLENHLSLDGQRKFQWNIKSEADKMEAIHQSFLDGLIPEENVNCKRYRSFLMISQTH